MSSDRFVLVTMVSRSCGMCQCPYCFAAKYIHLATKRKEGDFLAQMKDLSIQAQKQIPPRLFISIIWIRTVDHRMSHHLRQRGTVESDVHDGTSIRRSSE
jgi:hypothetical protein